MRYIELLIDGKSIKSQSKIDSILKSKNLNWVIDSEIENAVIELKNNTIIWHSGYFFGNWINGIFEGGKFMGNWKSGVKVNQ